MRLAKLIGRTLNSSRRFQRFAGRYNWPPPAVPARLGLAKALRQLDRKREALEALEPTRDTAPDDPAVHFLLAQIYRDLGRTAEAQQEEAKFKKLQRAP
jgi:predicted Zn-dependent protease